MKKLNSGRLVALTLALVILVGFTLHRRSVEIQRNCEYNSTAEYVVEHGDTLWDIAQLYSDNRHDVRDVVRTIRELSECTATIHAGQRLTIPVYEIMK